ncbi:MAG: hypothetical protein HOD92_04425 [Deltaproteobacteria bacterium]|jgi:hypothetical protein|nr:hypothetical protein [Deltaproteobacteria bacterium]MBT4526946.1 hypothetical protein [Deltaproteobacteria bacterium]
MNKSRQQILIAISLLLASVAVSYASLDSKTDALSNLGKPDYVTLAEVENQIVDPEEAILFLNEAENE